MNDENLIEKALCIATQAHFGQRDKAGAPYILHPIRVMCRCTTDNERIVALLHDTIEDTDVTAEYLLAQRFPIEIVAAVLSISRKANESYEDFIIRAKKNPIGRKVKMYDIEDNMDFKRNDAFSERDLVRINRYIKAYRYLKNRFN